MAKIIVKAKEWQGVDIDIPTSLREYGLIWNDNNEFIYGVGVNLDGTYRSFARATMTFKEYLDLFTDLGGLDVAHCCGIGEQELKGRFPCGVHDFILYYGYINVFGECYNPQQAVIIDDGRFV